MERRSVLPRIAKRVKENKTYGGDGGNDGGEVEYEVGEVLGYEEEEEEEEEEEVVSHDASEIIEGLIRSVFGRRGGTSKSWLGVGADMIQGTEAPSKLGNRDRARVRC
jgi:hypothetical protein